MSSRTVRRGTLAVLGLGAVLAVSPAFAPVASAAMSCAFNAATHTMSVSVNGEPVTLGTDQSLITVNGDRCGLASLTNTDTITITGSAAYETANDGMAASLAPGFTKEASGKSEIEIDIMLGANPGNPGFGDPGQGIAIRDTAAADKITIGTAGADVNGDDDADVRVTSTAGWNWSISASTRNDLVSGQGSAGTGKPTTVGMGVLGGAGNDILRGGHFGDTLEGGPGDDVLDGFGNAAAAWGDAPSYAHATGPVTRRPGR